MKTLKSWEDEAFTLLVTEMPFPVTPSIYTMSERTGGTSLVRKVSTLFDESI
jgi:hypothetical protein